MASLPSLPIHLVADILCELDDIAHLPAALLAHRIFYSAYQDTPALTLDILRRQVGHDLITLAVAALVSERGIREARGVDGEAFLMRYYERPLELLEDHAHPTLAQALRMGKLHNAVEILQDDFSKRALSRLYNLNKEGPLSETRRRLSPGEQHRISRALYRIHIYNNLFLSDPSQTLTHKPEKALFFERHSPWVNEQMFCVFDFLEDRLHVVLLTLLSASPAWRAIVINGFEWGTNLTDWMASKMDDLQHERCLSLGIPLIQKLVKASSCQNWQEFETLADISSVSKSTFASDFLAYNADRRRRRPSSGSSSAAQWDTSDVPLMARPANEGGPADEDGSPRDVWTRAYFGPPVARMRLGTGMVAPRWFCSTARGMGYVVWDGRRIDEDIFHTIMFSFSY